MCNTLVYWYIGIAVNTIPLGPSIYPSIYPYRSMYQYTNVLHIINVPNVQRHKFWKKTFFDLVIVVDHLAFIYQSFVYLEKEAKWRNLCECIVLCIDFVDVNRFRYEQSMMLPAFRWFRFHPIIWTAQRASGEAGTHSIPRLILQSMVIVWSNKKHNDWVLFIYCQSFVHLNCILDKCIERELAEARMNVYSTLHVNTYLNPMHTNWINM